MRTEVLPEVLKFGVDREVALCHWASSNFILLRASHPSVV
jgi:hypothetical protein